MRRLGHAAGIGLGRENGHARINLRGIGVDQAAVARLGQMQGVGRFAAGRGARHQHDGCVDGESAARILPNDQQRLCRAREVFEATQTPLSMWQKNKQHQPPPHWQFEKILLWPDRGTLYQRCDDRFLQMLAQGAVHEVTTLLSANIPTRAGVRKIIGVREIENYLAGNITLNEATALAQQATRHYAKRQYTWFRQQWPATTRVNI
ncbi:MAG: hypothetical protein EB121_06130 [Alphaproteobacteria bacterium]|nr:hypothetical protein [Alphaproteobacteria bacterium]